MKQVARFMRRRISTWATMVLVTAPMAAFVAGCGGGGESSTPEVTLNPIGTTAITRTAPLTADDVLAVKLASILIEVSPSTATFFNTAIDAGALTTWAEAPGSSGTGCPTTTREKQRPLPVTVDTIVTTYDCFFVHGNHLTAPSSLVYKGAQTRTLEELSDPQMPLGAAWRYREQWVSRATADYVFQLLDGTAMDGKPSGDTTYANLAEHAADGSQVDTTTFETHGTETSSRGNSDFTMRSVIRCTFNPGGLQAGTCVNTTARLQGTVYGQTVDATLTRQSTDPLTYVIDNGAQRTTIVVEKVGPEIFESRYRIRTPSGADVLLTGEDTNWLGVF